MIGHIVDGSLKNVTSATKLKEVIFATLLCIVYVIATNDALCGLHCALANMCARSIYHNNVNISRLLLLPVVRYRTRIEHA
jgi:hypothetical protein